MTNHPNRSKRPIHDAMEREAKNAQRAKMTAVLDKAILEIEDRIENGDVVMTKMGLARVEMTGRDLRVLGGVA